MLSLPAAACTKEGEPQLHFEVKHWDLITGSTLPHTLEERRVEVSPIPTGMHVTGAIVLPDPCDRLTAQLDRSHESLRLLVRVVGSPSHGERCGVGRRKEVDYYEAQIRGILPGVYRLQVFHDFGRRATTTPAGERSSGVVLDQSVRVPGV